MLTMTGASTIVVLFSAVIASVAANIGCSFRSENATIHILSDTEYNVWAIGVSDINLTIDIVCPKVFDDIYYFYLLQNGDNITHGQYFSYIDIYAFRIDEYNRPGQFQISSFEINETYKEIQVNIAFNNLTISDNLFRIAVKSYFDGGVFYSPPFMFHYCPVPELPVVIITNYYPFQLYSYLEVIPATCQGSVLFVKDIYQNSMNITCGRHAKWKIPEHECIAGCPNPAQGLIQTYPTLPTTKYKFNTRLGVSCSNGRVFSSGQPTVFIQSIVCQSNGEWNHVKIGCWQDQVVDFKFSELTLISGIKTVFACESGVRSHKVRTTVDETVLDNWDATWLITTPDSKLNGIIAICEVIDNNEIVVEKLSTLLNVLYLPELLHDAENLQFGLEKDKSGRVIIEISSNPVLSFNNIKITKNETQIPNYYLIVEDYTHKVVVDFLEVEDTDFGNYVLSMTSVSPVAKITKANFTIFQNTAEQQGFNAVHAAVTGIGSILIIALVIVAIFMARRMTNKQETSNATVANEAPDTVIYEANVPDHHNYEDIEGKREDEPTGYEGKDGYVNIEIGEPTQQNTYTDEQNRTTQPSSNNANQRVALKPPARQNRVNQESPYIMPSVTRW